MSNKLSNENELLEYLEKKEEAFKVQDSQLILINNKLDDLKHISLNIKDELDKQQTDLTKLTTEVDQTQIGLIKGNKKVDNMLNKQSCCNFL